MKSTAQIIEGERARLALIGSDRDPALFQAMRAHVRDERTMNRSVIVNFTDETTRFGCRFRCRFCSWRQRAIDMGDICPKPEGLKQFLSAFSGYKVTISGGGDPLYRLDKNWPRLYSLITAIHDLGFLVEVVTKETAILRDVLGWDGQSVAARPGMYETIQRIDAFSLSYENATRAACDEVAAISAHRQVRVSKVCTPGFCDRNPQFAEQYSSQMLAAGAYQVVLREDFYDPKVTETDALSIASAVRRSGGAVRWLPNTTCSDNLFLINDEVYRGDAALGGSVHQPKPEETNE